MEPVTLYHGDCLEVMQSLPDNSIDLVLADPPYGITACKWDSVIPLEPLWKELKRITKQNSAIVMTASQPFTTTLISSNPKMFKYCWVWDKRNPANFLNSKHQPLRVTEDVVVFSQKKNTFNPIKEIRGKPRNKGLYIKPGGSDNYGVFYNANSFNNEYYPTNLLSISNAKRKGKMHPTQKPVALMEYLIKTYTNENETILDFCAGSGTTGVAALNTNRKAVLIEKDADYFKIMQDRINNHLLKQTSIDVAADNNCVNL